MKGYETKPKLSMAQLKHLSERLGLKNKSLDDIWRQSSHPQEPEAVSRARQIVDEYEAELDRQTELEKQSLRHLHQWYREQILFRSPAEALALIKGYEMLSLTDALKAGSTMEDRNDDPILPKNS